MNSAQSASLTYDPNLVIQLQNDILEEIYKAAKFPRIKAFRTAVKPFFLKSTRRFSEFIAEIDAFIKDKGFVFAAQQALLRLSDEVISARKENIPADGPLVIASNHPGTYDGFVIISQLPRNDIHVVVSGIPFFRNLPNAGKHLIYTAIDTHVRMNVIRKSIRHLEEGGSLLIFPSGRIDPDPSILPGAEESLHIWSRSIEVFMRKVPQAKLVLAITSGVLSGEFINHPFTKLFPDNHERRRIMEFMQIIKQMVRGKPISLSPRVNFSEKITYDQIKSGSDQFIFEKASQLLKSHMENFYSR